MLAFTIFLIFGSVYLAYAQGTPEPEPIPEKFDLGLYDKIQDIIKTPPTAGSGPSDGIEYYTLLIIVNGGSPYSYDVATQSKKRVVELLESYGAQNISVGTILSFVTADVPVSEIDRLSAYSAVHIVGDGMLEFVASMDVAKDIVNGEPRDLARPGNGLPYDGAGITIAVLDSGIDHQSVNSKVIKQIYCDGNNPCTATIPRVEDSHGTRVAGVIAASNVGQYDGIAQGVKLLDGFISVRGTAGDPIIRAAEYANSLEWSLQNGADIVNISSNISNGSDQSSSCEYGSSSNFVTEEAVDRGMLVVVSAGNEGYTAKDEESVFESVAPPACSGNVISVGAISDDNDNNFSDFKIYYKTSRGPTNDGLLKPEIVAPGKDIMTPCFAHPTILGFNMCDGNSAVISNNMNFTNDSGTSIVAPMVSAAATILKEANPNYNPLEIKSALLLGAKWTSVVPCTSVQFEHDDKKDECSNMHRPANKNMSNKHPGLQILNNVGFGILDIKESLDYTLSQNTHILKDGISSSPGISKTYKIYISPSTEPAKIILSWNNSPSGTISGQASAQSTPKADLGMSITKPDGTTINADSRVQVNEFAVFDSMSGTYTVTVTRNQSDYSGYTAFVLATTGTISNVPAITLNGNALQTVERGTRYIDMGATAHGGFDVKIKGTVDTSRIGSYTVTYEAADAAGNVEGRVNRVVEVIDTTRPVITLSGSNPLSIEKGKAYRDPGATTDDGSPVRVTGTVDTGKVGTYIIRYDSTDDSGNSARTVTRTVNVVSASPSQQTLFSDDFQSTIYAKWMHSGSGYWRQTTSQIHDVPVTPGHYSTNYVANADRCTPPCTLGTKDTISLTGYDSATLSFWRYVDSGLDSGEYLKVEVYNGSTWNMAYYWTQSNGDDDRWHKESLDLSDYLGVSNFKVRFVAKMSLSSEDVQIDDVMVRASGHGPSGTPTSPIVPSPLQPPPSGSVHQSIYLADTDDREILAISSGTGSLLGSFVQARSSDLDHPWDLKFGPDGHLYVSDYTDGKIHRYHGATGKPYGISHSDSQLTDNLSFPRGMTWNQNTLYVATLMGIERISLSGNTLGIFGDAALNPPNRGVPGINAAYDVVFCTNMYVTDYRDGNIKYYSASTGKYLGTIGSFREHTYMRAAGLACGPAIAGTGTSLYQSGGDPGQINEIDPSSGRIVKSFTSTHIDEPYGMAFDNAGNLYVANKDDDNILKISSQGTVSVFSSGYRFDDPRGIAVGPEYNASSGSAGMDVPAPDDVHDADNKEPEIALTMQNGGDIITSAITLNAESAHLDLVVHATDPEGDQVTISLAHGNVPEHAITFEDLLNGTARITINPSELEPIHYAFVIEAQDPNGNRQDMPYAVDATP